jgi:TRAP-type C4-dicarboxylate transport system permease small subunit
MAYTSMEKGHIAVDIFFRRLPFRVQYILEAVTESLGLFIFIIAAWQCTVYGLHLKNHQEVSLTLAIPIYPVALGIALGCALLCLVLAFNLIRALRRVLK